MKKRINVTSRVVWGLAFMLILVCNVEAFISGVTVEAVSSNFADVPLHNPGGAGGFNRYAQYTVDNSIDYLGIEGSHRNLPDGDAGSMWLTEFRTDDCTNDYVVYNLNGTYNLTSMDIWNYNENPGNGYQKWGIKTMDVSVSLDNVNWLLIGNVTLNAAPGLEGVDFRQNISLVANGVRYVKFNNLTNLDGTNFAAGLSQVEFIPEPTTMVLMGLGGVTLFRRSRRNVK